MRSPAPIALVAALAVACSASPGADAGRPGECARDSDCPADRPFCTGGDAGPACACIPSYEVVNLADGGLDEDFPLICPTPCKTSHDCNPGTCLASGVCGLCDSDGDCPSGTRCRFRVCESPCSDGHRSCNGILGSVGDAARASGVDGTRAAFGCISVVPASSLSCELSTMTPWTACEACSSDCECGLGQRCVEGDCTCVTSGDCPSGRICGPAGVCEPCWTDVECGCGRFCADGRCVPGCHDNQDCESLGVGYRVCLGDGRCAYCATDSDCPHPGMRCFADGCYSDCAQSGCPGDVVCEPNGRCGCSSVPFGPPDAGACTAPPAPFVAACDAGGIDAG